MSSDPNFQVTRIVNSQDLKVCYNNCKNLIDENKRNLYISSFFVKSKKKYYDLSSKELLDYFKQKENLVIEVSNYNDIKNLKYVIYLKNECKKTLKKNFTKEVNSIFFILTKTDYLETNEKNNSDCSPDGFYYGAYNTKVRFIIGRQYPNFCLIVNNIKEKGTDKWFFNNKCGLGGSPPCIGVKIPRDGGEQ